MNIFFRFNCFFSIVCFAVAMTPANPLQPMPVSEVQVIDSTHWTIEIDVTMLEIYPALQVPCSTDTITLFCGPSNSSPPPDSFKTCAAPEQVTKDHIALLTPAQFPKIKLKPGWTLFAGVIGTGSLGRGATILTGLTGKNSMVAGLSSPYCCNPIDCSQQCRSEIYTISTCPSLGISNSAAQATISGVIVDTDSLPLADIVVFTDADSTIARTDIAGRFTARGLSPCKTYNLHFTDASSGKWVSDTVIGPLALSAGQVLSLSVRLDHKVPTSIKNKAPAAGPTSGSIRFVKATGDRDIVVTVPGNGAARGQVRIYAINGLLMRLLPFFINGPGTYTIHWDGRDQCNRGVPAGTYMCRVQAGGGPSCAGLITR